MMFMQGGSHTAAGITIMCMDVMLVIEQVLLYVLELGFLNSACRQIQVRSEGHGVQPVAASELRYLFKVHPPLHGLAGCAVQDLF